MQLYNRLWRPWRNTPFVLSPGLTRTMMKILLPSLVFLYLVLYAFYGQVVVAPAVVPANSYSGKPEKISVSMTEPTHRTDTICKNTTGLSYEWKLLCDTPFLEVFDNMMIEGKHIDVVQIGAHVGWSSNDPLCVTMGKYLESLSNIEKKQVHWKYIEPSPPNYKGLLKNIAQYSYLCDMSSVQAAIVPDSYNGTGSMPFYQMDECIDVNTGYDSKSGKKLPSFLSQLSSFDYGGIRWNEHVFRRRGLDPKNYYNKINVTAVRFSDLMADIMGNKGEAPYLMLVDTQGMDCKIILGISKNSPYLPQYLIYENNMCTNHDQNATKQDLERLGYNVTVHKREQNAFAFRSIS